MLTLCLSCAAAFAQSDLHKLLYNRSFTQLSRDTAEVNRLILASVRQHNNADSAIVLLEKAFTLSRRIGFTDGSASALLGIGTNLFNKGELVKARQVFRNAYPYCHNSLLKKTDWVLFWYNNMASTYAVQGHNDTAAFYYYKALDHILTKPKQDSSMCAVILANLGSVWQRATQYRQSLFYSYRALDLALELKDSGRVADISQNIGLAMSGMGDTPQCYRWLRAATALHMKLGNYLTAEIDYCALAMNSGNTDTALYYYNKALETGRLTRMEPSHKIYVGLGYNYLKTGRLDSASYYLKKAEGRAKALSFPADLVIIYSGLADVYRAQHNAQLAAAYQKAYSDLHDSLENSGKTAFANTLEIKYRTAEKDREIADARLQLLTRDYKLKQKNNWIIFAGCISLVLIVLLANLYRGNLRRQKLEKQTLLNLQQQQQLDNLQAVMDGEEKERTRIGRELHDGIMVQLAVIKMKLRKLRTEQEGNGEATMDAILQQLDQTSMELRRTAHNLMPDMLLENGLTDAVYYYCSSLQRETGIPIIFQHYGSLPRLLPEAELYLYRITQELLQNIIKHAHASKALVQLNYHPPLLSVSVEDNGVGFDQEVMGTGMGLKSIYSRLRVLGGTIDIRSNKFSGTAVFMELNVAPLQISKTHDHADQGSHSR